MADTDNILQILNKWQVITPLINLPWNVEAGIELVVTIVDLLQSNYQTLQGCSHQL
jgi:hypothetical protein